MSNVKNINKEIGNNSEKIFVKYEIIDKVRSEGYRDLAFMCELQRFMEKNENNLGIKCKSCNLSDAFVICIPCFDREVNKAMAKYMDNEMRV